MKTTQAEKVNFKLGDLVTWKKDVPWQSDQDRNLETYGSGPFKVVEVIPVPKIPKIRNEASHHQWAVLEDGDGNTIFSKGFLDKDGKPIPQRWSGAWFVKVAV